MSNQNPNSPPRSAGPHEGRLKQAIERLIHAGMKTDQLLIELSERTDNVRVKTEAAQNAATEDQQENCSLGYNIHEQAEAIELRNKALRRLIDELAI